MNSSLGYSLDRGTGTTCPIIIRHQSDFRRVVIQRRWLQKVREDLKKHAHMSIEPFTQQRIDALDREINEYSARIDAYESGEQQLEKPHRLDAKFMADLPNLLIRARANRGISQEELARQVGVDRAQICRYEKSLYAEAPLHRIIAIFKALDGRTGVELARELEQELNRDALGQPEKRCKTPLK